MHNRRLKGSTKTMNVWTGNFFAFDFHFCAGYSCLTELLCSMFSWRTIFAFNWHIGADYFSLIELGGGEI